MQNLFVYGTLLSSELREKLTGKPSATIPAVLKDYKMYCVKNCDYPAIISEKGAETNGKILFNVDDFDLQILSDYEGDEYQQKKVDVVSNEKMVDALTFVWIKGNESLVNREWDFEYFRRNRLKFYFDELK
jgi:gamma-glutamylcyclotransferase (GGCT)/AIG2-like uncharacterized protein YtfP